MKTVKMFDWFDEIWAYLNEKGYDEDYDLCDLSYDIHNDAAIKFWAETDYDSEFKNAVGQYLLDNGCEYGERVLIWISW